MRRRCKRKKRSALERLRIVEETLVPGASVARVAGSHGINANPVFAWRKLHRAGKLVDRAESAASRSQRLLPVTVGEAERPSALAASPTPSAAPARCVPPLAAASIQIQLPKAMVRVEGIADRATLRLIRECLRGGSRSRRTRASGLQQA